MEITQYMLHGLTEIKKGMKVSRPLLGANIQATASGGGC
jgi:hypothetical protein